MKDNKYLYKITTVNCTYLVVAENIWKAIKMAEMQLQREIISINKESNVPVITEFSGHD